MLLCEVLKATLCQRPKKKSCHIIKHRVCSYCFSQVVTAATIFKGKVTQTTKTEEESRSEKYLSIYMNNTVLLTLRTPQFKHENVVEVAKMYTVRSKTLGLIFF